MNLNLIEDILTRIKILLKHTVARSSDLSWIVQIQHCCRHSKYSFQGRSYDFSKF